jgi:tight adherence protein C
MTHDLYMTHGGPALLGAGIEVMSHPALPLAACAAVGVAVFLVVWWAVVKLRSEDLQQGNEWRYDISRINELRRTDPLYRLFQPFIQWLARFNRRAFPDSLPAIQREIQASGLSRFWLAEEYLGRIELLALMTAPPIAYLLWKAMALPGLILALGLVAALGYLLRRQLARRAHRRLQTIKRRMPFLLDLLTLLMEAGSSFLRALDEAVQEFAGHPLAVEFGRVLSDMNMGKTRTEAFHSLTARLSDDEINSIVTSILQGEQLGTPLANVFRTQADVLRIKRSQRAETVAGEAGVNMLLPGILIMASTVLIIIGPFAINYIYSGLGL